MRQSRARVVILPALFILAMSSGAAAAQERTGRQVYESICITCHGPDGKGRANPELTKVITLPDFSDCSFASREPDADWIAVAHKGGPARGFSPLMAPWAGTYSSQELRLAVSHLRTFCSDDRWPRGELNMPRPLVTGKAFPEDEAVVSTSTDTHGNGGSSKFIYERRIGAQHQVEIAVPFTWTGGEGNTRGVGDIALGYKRTLAHSSACGRIVSASLEVKLPTGSESRGLGGGVAVFEPFVTFGQLLPGSAFVQMQAGLELPSGDHPNEVFWRAAIGRSFEQGRFGRLWSPMIEALAARTLAEGGRIDWDVVPQIQITLNARQHIRVNGGVRMPVNNRAGRSTTVMFYLLWDWYDGGFFEGW